jgi:predicted acetyltransferase
MPPSNFTISKIGPESDGILRTLFQHYLRDMAQWFEVDAEPDGSYAYDFSSIWKNYDVYLAKVDAAEAGFALVGSAAEWIDDSRIHDVHEFFVMTKFRRQGIGQRMVTFLWNQYPGEWLVRVLEANAAAVRFWRITISNYSRNSQKEETRIVNGRAWRFFRFTSFAG